MNQELKDQLIEAGAENLDKVVREKGRLYGKRAHAEAVLDGILQALTLHSVHELDAQPEGAVVTDRDGDPWMKTENGRWLGEASLLREANSETSLQLEAWAPLHLDPFTGGRL